MMVNEEWYRLNIDQLLNIPLTVDWHRNILLFIEAIEYISPVVLLFAGASNKILFEIIDTERLKLFSINIGFQFLLKKKHDKSYLKHYIIYILVKLRL